MLSENQGKDQGAFYGSFNAGIALPNSSLNLVKESLDSRANIKNFKAKNKEATKLFNKGKGILVEKSF